MWESKELIHHDLGLIKAQRKRCLNNCNISWEHADDNKDNNKIARNVSNSSLISLVWLKRRFAVFFGRSLNVLLLLVLCLGFAFYMNLKCSSSASIAVPLGKKYMHVCNIGENIQYKVKVSVNQQDSFNAFLLSLKAMHFIQTE